MEEATCDDMIVTEEGVRFTKTPNRAIFPTPNHESGGGVAITKEAFDQILANGDGGEIDRGQLEWEDTGVVKQTRVGSSRVIEITQTSFGTERTVELSMVDLADADLEIRN